MCFSPYQAEHSFVNHVFFSGLQYVPKSTLHFNSNTPFSNIDTPQHSYVYMFDKGKNKHFPKPKHHVRSKYVKFSVGVRVYIYIYNRYIYIPPEPTRPLPSQEAAAQSALSALFRTLVTRLSSRSLVLKEDGMGLRSAW